MDPPSQTFSDTRCTEHGLAVGPTGACVLCRRDRTRRALASRLPRVLAAAGLGIVLLGGVALARKRTPSPLPIAGAAATGTAQLVEAPTEDDPAFSGPRRRPRELPAAPAAEGAEAARATSQNSPPGAHPGGDDEGADDAVAEDEAGEQAEPDEPEPADEGGYPAMRRRKRRLTDIGVPPVPDQPGDSAGSRPARRAGGHARSVGR
jgi:hypothetical protein